MLYSEKSLHDAYSADDDQLRLGNGAEESSPIQRPLGFTWSLSTLLVDVYADPPCRTRKILGVGRVMV